MKLKRKGVNTMLSKIEFATYMAYWKIKRRFMEMANEEDGMEALESIILIGVAVIIAAVVLKVLKGDTDDGSGGLIGFINGKIKSELDKIFK